MTVYEPGPYSVTIDYVQTSLKHTIELQCDTVGAPAIGTAPSAVTLRSRDGTGVLLNGAADAFWDLFRVFLPATTAASSYVLWKREPGISDKTFISGGDLTTPNGGGVGPVVLCWQAVMTMRTGNGNIMKINAMEPVTGGSFRLPIAASGVLFADALATYLLSGDNWVQSRDRSFPVAKLNLALGQNEKTFRARNRQ
jgi:hypothetical protein